MNCAKVIVEVIGEGRTDVGAGGSEQEWLRPTDPKAGVVPVLVHTLCGKPDAMAVKCRCYASLQGKTRAQKVAFSKRQARLSRSAGVVFVLDSEGDLRARQRELADGRDRESTDFPTAGGVAHPCIEAWLLADGNAIQSALSLDETPEVTDAPERLPAPCRDRKNNPKRVLSGVSSSGGRELSAKQKTCIAAAMNDMDLVRIRCPLGFAPFADEVENRIRPLF
jgi:hypothetical protein